MGERAGIGPPATEETTMRTINTKEVAALAHCHPKIVRTYVERGLLPPPMKVGNKHLWDHDEVVAALKATRQPGA